jgi:predicted SprT family Zn-dependent metalloprotease
MPPTFREPADVVQVVYDEMVRCGLEGFTFDWDRSVRRAGCCHHRTKTITLSYHYVSANLDKPDDIYDTVLHEIAHGLAGPGEGHGQAWKDICVRIGARPVRCYDSQRIAMPEGKYVAVCGGCGMVFRRHKKVRSARYHLRCGLEKGRLTFKLEGQ